MVEVSTNVGSIADGTQADDAGKRAGCGIRIASQADAARRVSCRDGQGGAVVGAVRVDRAALSEGARGRCGSPTHRLGADAAHPFPAAVVRSESTRLNSSHPSISYAVFCLKKKTNTN